MAKKYVVRLTKDERKMLLQMVKTGKGAARKLTHARVFVKADANGPAWPDTRIADALDVGVRTIESMRQRFVMEGLEAALNRKSGPPRRRKLDGKKESQLVKLACSDAPEGRERWTLRLLAGTLVELAVVESISHEAVRQTLKQTS
jgi:transposase